MMAGKHMKPKVSVILPVFNGKMFLRECIESVLRQSSSDWELVIGDDNSTDGTADIIKSFVDGRIKYSRNLKTEGLFKNLNLLLKKADAPIIRILCQDDRLEDECLEEEGRFFSAHPEIGMAFCKSFTMDTSGEIITKSALNDLPAMLKPAFSRQCFFCFGCMPSNLSSVSIRKQSFEDMGSFDESYQVSGDYEMWARICARKDLGIIHKHLVGIRVHKEQLSRKRESGIHSILENRKIRASLFPTLPEVMQLRAKRYVALRQNVLEIHYVLRTLLSGRFSDFLTITKNIEKKELCLSLLYWLVTVNNHIYKPKPDFFYEDRT